MCPSLNLGRRVARALVAHTHNQPHLLSLLEPGEVLKLLLEKLRLHLRQAQSHKLLGGWFRVRVRVRDRVKVRVSVRVRVGRQR